MEKWFLQSMWIAMFGFFKEFRPEDPYITQYLTHPPMNFTNEEVIQDVYPVSTYTCLGLTIIVFLITDYLRYKPIVILNAMSSVIAQLLLIYTRSVTSMMVMEVFYGTMTACEVAYYTYIYSKVEKKHYKKVSSHMKMACLLGRLISAILAQILIDNSVLTIPHLNYLTLLGAFFSLIWAFGLPPVKKSLYFHHNPENIHISDQTNQNFPAPKTACQRLWHDFNSAFRNNYVVQWSIWWAIGTSMYYQFMSYSQSLWQEISDEGTDFKITDNGSVEAVYTIISTLGVYLVGVMTIPSWWLIGVLTLSQGILLLKMSQEHLLSHAYVGYIIYGTFYHVMATVANCEVARNIPEDSYALVFGVNTFISLIIQTCMTVIINSSIGLKLTIRTQFFVYAVCSICVGLLYLIKALVSTYKMKKLNSFTISTQS